MTKGNVSHPKLKIIKLTLQKTGNFKVYCTVTKIKQTQRIILKSTKRKSGKYIVRGF